MAVVQYFILLTILMVLSSLMAPDRGRSKIGEIIRLYLLLPESSQWFWIASSDSKEVNFLTPSNA